MSGFWSNPPFLFLREPVAVLIVIAVLAACGVAVGQFVLRLRRRALAERESLIAPWTHTDAATPNQAREVVERTNLAAEFSLGERATAMILRRFGVPERLAPRFFAAIRPSSAVCLSVGFWFISPLLVPVAGNTPVRVLLAASGGLFGWFLPGLIADWSARRHRDAVVSGLPDALELLVICSEGGLALADGIDRIVVELRNAQPDLADELALTAADLKILPSQDQALARLATRVDAPIVRSVVTSLSQSMRYGTPLAQAMRVVAADLRTEALLKMEERVNKLPALLTIPMIVFILPTILLVAGGPAALKAIDMLTGTGALLTPR